jgi:hypothetical protein
MSVRILIVICILVSFFGQTQEDFTDSIKCKSYKILGDNSFAYNDFTAAVTNYLKSEKYCKNLDKHHFDKLIESTKKAISASKDFNIKTKYIDTLVFVYANAEMRGFYEQSNDLMRASFILKSSKPDLKKVDELFVRAMQNKNNSLSETQIILYFSNLYNIYLDENRELKPVLKRRIIKEYFELSELDINDKTKENLSIYFNNVIKDCQDILPDVEFFFNTLSKVENEKLVELNNLKRLLENKKCEESSYYEEIIDSLILIKPTFELYLTSAKCLRNRGDYSKEFSALYFAKKMATEESVIAEIDLLSAKSLFNAGKYSEAYKSAIVIKGSYYPDACIIAAQSVSMSKETCGDNLVEQKLNLYYANELLEIAKKSGKQVQKLIDDNTANFPNPEDLASIYLKKGQKITLKCWGVQILIP